MRKQTMTTARNKKWTNWGIVEEFRTELLGKNRLCLEVRCPHEECRRTHVVAKRAWLSSSALSTRPCPYCFRAYALPNVEIVVWDEVAATQPLRY